MKEIKKKISVEIEGVTYIPTFNFNSMSKFGELYGLTINDFSKLSEPSLSQLITLAFLGIQEYCRINKMELPFDRYKLGELPTEKIRLLIQSISVNMMSFTKPERT